MKVNYEPPSILSKNLSHERQVALTGYILGQTLSDMTVSNDFPLCGVVAVFDQAHQGAVFCMSGEDDISQELVNYKIQVAGDDFKYTMSVCLKDLQGLEAGLQIKGCDGSLYFCNVDTPPKSPQCITGLVDSKGHVATECSIAGCSL